MKIIQNNPYRIAGILSNVTTKELQKQKGKIKAFSKVGKKITSELDFEFLDSIERTEESIEKSFSNIEQNQDKVNNSLFWFLKSSPFDETAISYLIKGDNEKAKEIWGKVTNGKEVNSKNFSAFNNIGTLKLLSKSEREIKEGIEAKIKLIESDYFENFVHTVADQTFTIDKKKQSQKFIDELLIQFKNKYSSTDAINLFSNCNGSTQKYLSEKVTEEPIHNIESYIESTKRKKKENKSDAYSFGLKLFINTKDDLTLLKSLLGVSDLNYKRVADELAKEIMQCGIDCFNENQGDNSNKDYLMQVQKLNKTALSIAVGSLTRDRAKDHISTLEEMKDKSLLQTVELLQSVKDTYETNEATIRQQVKDLKEKDVEIRLGIKLINQTAVEDNIKNSINWKEVNNLLNTVLDSNTLEQVKESSNNNLKAKFIELTKWLKEKSSSKSVITRIINDYKKIPPRLYFEILSSEITNTENNPLYTKFVRYIGLNLNIKVESPTSVNFYLKYINPDGSIKRNSKTSPIGYTQLITKEINNDLKIIELPGWGNSNECMYKIGEHRIEVYVDEYLIHSKKYIVDLVPSEKFGRELKKAESELEKINTTQYFKSELDNANLQMYKIQKFKLFRGSSKKQAQIENQNKKIVSLQDKSKSEKRRNIKNQEEIIYKLKMELSLAKY
ncbi:hypothetical protein [Tenacibaculum finnmarkense]|uniref:hypothetical protein n=1 Tax=Tenacibaculum finnmarkense TaxID=2781243 RepID=UPI001E59CA46|nr:hypothetical protein [Tenacibaculum finnmarkense]MCD8448005.1 hypothetical protein [Tenacibaculum finnmarkense genomovar finnmarkense]